MTNKYGDIRFIHFADDFREVPLDGGATVAYLVDFSGTVTYATSICSRSDKFTKEYGRNRSAGLLVQYMNTAPEIKNGLDDLRSGRYRGSVADIADMMDQHGYVARRVLDIPAPV